MKLYYVVNILVEVRNKNVQQTYHHLQSIT